MNKTKELVLNSLNYYDANLEKNQKLFKKIFYYSVQLTIKDLEHHTITFYNKKKEIIFKTRYEHLGFYNVRSNSWTWSWSMPRYTKNTTQLARKVLNYGLDLNIDESSFLKEELITSRFKISTDIQLDIHAAIASYLTKKPMIFKLIHDDTIDTAIGDNMYQILEYPYTTSNINFLYLLDEKGMG